MKDTIISFIGGGNMTSSLVGGLINSNIQLRIVDINPEPLAASFPVHIYTEINDGIANADVIVLAVKPQVLPEVTKSLANYLKNINKLPLIISIVAGIRIKDLHSWLNIENIPIVRTMPNTPALVQSGATALYADRHVSQEQQELAEKILRAVGLTVWLTDENLLDVVTALSGSGPAYFFKMMEALEKSAIKLGLPENEARLLTIQTAFGAAKMALESNENTATLRAKVTSKGGTTEQALNVLQEGGFQELLEEALQAAHKRSISLAEQFGNS
jgi:pyrroline-5-carboxylate reductase